MFPPDKAQNIPAARQKRQGGRGGVTIEAWDAAAAESRCLRYVGRAQCAGSKRRILPLRSSVNRYSKASGPCTTWRKRRPSSSASKRSSATISLPSSTRRDNKLLRKPVTNRLLRHWGNLSPV